MVSILNENDKCHILYLFDAGHTKAQLARDFNVSPRTIGRVIDQRHLICAYEIEEHDQDEYFDDDPLEDNRSFSYRYILTPDSLTLIEVCSDGESNMETIDQSDDRFDSLSKKTFDAANDQGALSEIFSEMCIKKNLEKISLGKITVNPQENRVYYTSDDNQKIEFSGRLVSRIISAAQNGESDLSGLVAFAERLSFNVSKDAVGELYDFLEASDVRITPDGLVECYKKVNANYTDVYTGKIDNSVGATPEMPRALVNDDRNQTCSRGLHVCSESYLNSYPGERVMLVHVDPQDFVSIPVDYSFAKARVCKYQVVKDVTEKFYHTTY